MGKYIAILFIVFSFQLFSQWKKVTTVPQNFDNTIWLDVYFLNSNPNYGWVCGFGGNVIRTTDGGNSWQGTKIQKMIIDTTYVNGNPKYDTTYIPTANQLESIHFVNENIGFVSGDNQVFKSTDGGASWKSVGPDKSEVWGVYFIDENYGYAQGGGCDGAQQFHRTTDGGLTWTTFFETQLLTGLSDVIVYDKDGLGYAASSGFIWRTDNGGRAWYIFSKSGNPDWQEEITNIANTFLVPYTEGCYGGGKTGGMRMTTDLGKSWREFETGQSMFGAFLLDSLRGWSCGDGSSTYYTSDGGKTWELRNCGIGDNVPLDDMWFISDSIGFVVGRGVYRTYYYDTVRAKILTNDGIYICKGDSLLLNAAGNYNYNYWYDKIDTLNVLDSTKSIYVSKAGWYYLQSYNDYCEFKIWDSIEVKYYPDVEINIMATNGTEFCQWDSTKLYLTNIYKDINWSTGSKQDTIEVSKSGTYTVSIIDTNGCEWTKDIQITVFPQPNAEIVLIGRSGFCQGDSAILKTTRPFVSYKWYSKNVSDSLISKNDSLIIFDSGEYYCIVEDEHGCKDTSDLVKIEVWGITNRLKLTSIDDLDYIDFDTVAILNQDCRKLKIFNNSGANVTIDNIFVVKNIEFSIPQSQLPIKLNPYESKTIDVCFRPDKKGFFNDTLIINDTCSAHIINIFGWGKSNIYRAEADCNTNLIISSDSLIDGGYFEVSIYPNPVSDELKIDLSGVNNHLISIKLYDIYGRELAKLYEGKAQNINTFTYPTKDLPQGIYFVRVNAEKEQIIKSFIVVK